MGYTVSKKREEKKGRKEKWGGGAGRGKLFMCCLSAHSNCFSLLHNQAACTGSSEIAAYVTGPALEITNGISLLQNTTHLLLDTHIEKQRTVFLVSDENLEISSLWCTT